MILPLLYWIEIASNIKYQNLFLCILEIIFEKWIITAVSIQYLIKGMKLIFFYCLQLRNLFQWVVNQENNHANIQENHANLSPGQSLKCLIRKKKYHHQQFCACKGREREILRMQENLNAHKGKDEN